MSEYLELSSRLQAIETGASDGASCNTFVVQDSVAGKDGIAEMMQWLTEIPSLQGAPTLILSNIRPRGSMTSRGVEVQGVCSLITAIDSIVSYMKRPGKKNSACVCFVDANHGDLKEFLSPEFTASLQTVYLGVLVDPKETYSDEVVEMLVEAYHNKRIFINKIYRDAFGNLLYPNVCNEIRQIHKGLCTLGAIKLHEMSDLSRNQFAQVFAECAEKLISFLPHTKRLAEEKPHLYNYSAQVGLGFVGMSNFLGKLGTTYQDVVNYYDDEESLVVNLSATRKFFRLMWDGLESAARIQREYNVERMFTSQPTAHTALRLKDGDYAVSPELSPIIGGTRSAADNLVRVYRKSEIDSDKDLMLVYPKYVQTQEEVPYEIYRRFCEILQELITDEVGEFGSHTFSHTYYDDEFTVDDFDEFMSSNLGSLYYRLEPVNVSRDKTLLDDEAGDLSDMFLYALESTQCPINPQEKAKCDVCSM